MKPEWLKRRGYRHFDRPVGAEFADKVRDPKFVSRHSFSPLLHRAKSEKRYKVCPKSKKRIISTKDRPIKYASHRDACIFAYYAHRLGALLDEHYVQSGLSDSVIAYRALGQGNYDFAADTYAFAKQNSPVTILAFDVTSFFDNLDHGLLKRRLKRIFGVAELPEDWLRVFRAVTRYHFVDLERLKANPDFASRFAATRRDPIATVAELKAAGVPFVPNPTPKKGIPQGTPMSAVASNLCMIDFDASARTYCVGIGALYRRYSDDILVICKPEHTKAAEAEILRLIGLEGLEIAPHKTEVTLFDADAPGDGKVAQYLGFMLGRDDAALRQSSLSRQWRKMRRAFRRTQRIASGEVAAGRADKAFTKRLRKRFTALKFRNFSSYARRSARAFGGGKTILRQVRRFERAAEEEFAALKILSKPEPPAS